MTILQGSLVLVGPSIALALARLYGPVRPFAAFALALGGQTAFTIGYAIWERQRFKRIKQAIADPNIQVVLTYTQQDVTTGSRLRTQIIGRLWTIPGLFLTACAIAVLFLGLQQLLS